MHRGLLYVWMPDDPTNNTPNWSGLPREKWMEATTERIP